MKHKLSGGDGSGKATQLQQQLNEREERAILAEGGPLASTTATPLAPHSPVVQSGQGSQAFKASSSLSSATT